MSDSTAPTDTEATPAPQADTTAHDEPQGSAIQDLDSALKELTKLRKESAAYRNQNKELREKAEAFDAAEAAKKTELERAQERIAQLEAAEKAASVAKTRAEVAAATGVPATLIVGNTEEEMTTSAEALMAWAAQRKPTSGAPRVESAGRADNQTDRDAQARAILGL